jgi:hypothetical protein
MNVKTKNFGERRADIEADIEKAIDRRVSE